jgi:capsular exopolysaccharide synthesis family protein
MRNWLIVVGCTVAGLGLAVVSTLVATPKYTATTQLFVSVRVAPDSSTGEMVQGSTFARQAVVSYVQVATSPLVLDRVVSELGLETDAHVLAQQIKADSPANTVLINLSVTDPDPEFAAQVANTAATAFADVVSNELETSPTNPTSPVNMKVVSPALPPQSPSSPRLLVNLAIGFLLGIAIGVGLAILRATLDTGLRNLQQVEAAGKPLLGKIGNDPSAIENPVIARSDPTSPLNEAYRSLRTNLLYANPGGALKAVVVTGPTLAIGKSTVTCNLALSLASSGRSVLLVDADLRRPRVAKYMGLQGGGAGLSDLLVGRVQLRDVIQPWGNSTLSILPSGRIPPSPSELLDSPYMEQLMTIFKSRYDVVVVDSPPALSFTDSTVVAKVSDGALIVTAWGKTKRSQLEQTIAAIEAIDANVIGVVLNRVPLKEMRHTAYYYYSQGSGRQRSQLPTRHRAKAPVDGRSQ